MELSNVKGGENPLIKIEINGIPEKKKRRNMIDIVNSIENKKYRPRLRENLPPPKTEIDKEAQDAVDWM